jgi:hypothetical protein
VSKPVAVPKEMVCSECGLDWDLHPENPRRRDCIELLLEHGVTKYVPAPTVIWNTHYCNWGHANCYIHHFSNWGQTGTWDGTVLTNQSITYTGLSAVQDDDPDDGVAAQVS